MAAENERKEWSVLSRSVQGASHIRAGLPNQDYIAQKAHQGYGLPIMLAVADGHGSATYFRSHLGARFAVEIALEEMERSISEINFPVRNIAIVKELMKQLPRTLVERWHERVRLHWRQTPLTQEEWQRFQENDPKLFDAFMRASKENPSLPYGATLLGVLVTPSFIFYFQLGDGDILIVTEDHQVRPAVKGDTRLLANETTSLCTTSKERALHDFRISFDHLDGPEHKGPHPALILLSTDGYSNSFNTPKGFQQVGLDIMSILARDGAERVKQELPNWLRTATDAGSGDDISLGLIWHTTSVLKAATFLKYVPPDAPANVTQLRRPETQSDPSDHRSSAQFLQEPPRSEDDFLIDYEGPLSTQKVPDIRTLLDHSKEGPPKELWMAQNYQPPARQETIPAEVAANASPAQNEPEVPKELFPSQEPVYKASEQPEQASSPQTQAPPSVEGNSTAPFTGTNEQPKQQAQAPEQAQQQPGPGPAFFPQHAQKQAEAEHKPVQVPSASSEPLVKAGSPPLIVKQDGRRGEYRTISEALKQAQPGMSICVHPGTYRERLIVDRNVTIFCQQLGTVVVEYSAPCLEIKDHANRVHFNGIYFRGKAGSVPESEVAAVEIDAGQALFTNCNMTSDSRACVRIQGRGTNPTLKTCFVSDGKGTGVVFCDSAQGRLEQCTIEHQSGAGIEIRSSTPTIIDCLITRNQKEGILVWKSGGGRIDQCRIENYSQCGIKISEDGNPEISRCHLNDGSGPGVLILEHGKGTIFNCWLYNTGSSGVHLQSGNQTSIRSCHFIGGGREGAIIIDAQSQGIIDDCHIKEQIGPGILVLQGGNVQLRDSELREGKAQGVLLKGKSKGIFDNCILSNHAKNAIEVREESTLTLNRVHISQERQSMDVISLEEESYVSPEHCRIEAPYTTGLYLNRKATAFLQDSHIYSKASNAVVVLNESRVTLRRSEVQIEGSEKSIHHDESSYVIYQD